MFGVVCLLVQGLVLRNFQVDHEESCPSAFDDLANFAELEEMSHCRRKYDVSSHAPEKHTHRYRPLFYFEEVPDDDNDYICKLKYDSVFPISYSLRT